MRKLLLGCLFTTSLLGNVIMQYDMQFEFGRSHFAKITINGAELNCRCGKPAMVVIFHPGCFKAYCYRHMPDIQEQIDIDLLAKDLDEAKK